MVSGYFSKIMFYICYHLLTYLMVWMLTKIIRKALKITSIVWFPHTNSCLMTYAKNQCCLGLEKFSWVKVLGGLILLFAYRCCSFKITRKWIVMRWRENYLVVVNPLTTNQYSMGHAYHLYGPRSFVALDHPRRQTIISRECDMHS